MQLVARGLRLAPAAIWRLGVAPRGERGLATQAIAVTVVYTDRIETGGTVRRIISARLSNRRERQAYFEALAQA